MHGEPGQHSRVTWPSLSLRHMYLYLPPRERAQDDEMLSLVAMSTQRSLSPVVTAVTVLL
jgi:hypothetical protein